MLQELGEISETCSYWGIPLLAMMYPRGQKVENEHDVELVKHAARVGSELGVDIVKTNYTGDPDSFKEVVEGALVPVVIAGGPKVDTDELDNFSNRYAGNSFIEKVTKKLQETFSATSHAPVNFVPEHEIKAMFGNSLSKIVNNNNSRSINFVDKSVLKEDAQGLSIATKDRTLAARRLTLMAKAKGWSSISFDGNQLFLEEAYEEATRAVLVVKPSSEEQARFFKEVHEAKKLDSFMPFGGMKESKKKDIDKDIENPGHSHEQAPVPVQAPVYNARIPTRMK